MTPGLVIFDCDGVLVDSETIACRVDADLFTEAGFPTTPEEVMQRYVGRSAAFMMSDIEARHSRALPQDFPSRMHTAIAEAFDRELRAVEGVASAIADLPVRRCVASSSTPERIERSLRVTGLLAHFHPHIFSATQVARGKPAPDLFLFAAQRMAASPLDCIVIEDSLAGVEAARAAGMRAIGFTGASHCDEAHPARLRSAGADVILTRMADLPAALRGLSGRSQARRTIG